MTGELSDDELTTLALAADPDQEPIPAPSPSPPTGVSPASPCPCGTCLPPPPEPRADGECRSWQAWCSPCSSLTLWVSASPTESSPSRRACGRSELLGHLLPSSPWIAARPNLIRRRACSRSTLRQSFVPAADAPCGTSAWTFRPLRAPTPGRRRHLAPASRDHWVSKARSRRDPIASRPAPSSTSRGPITAILIEQHPGRTSSWLLMMAAPTWCLSRHTGSIGVGPCRGSPPSSKKVISARC